MSALLIILYRKKRGTRSTCTTERERAKKEFGEKRSDRGSKGQEEPWGEGGPRRGPQRERERDKVMEGWARSKN